MQDSETQITSLTPLRANNQSLETGLEEANLHVQILSARLDVTSAQLFLQKKDISQARAALSKTGETLKTLETLLPADQAQLAKEMQSRLALAQKGLGSNDYAAMSDLDVLGTSLLQLENSYFARP